MNMCTSSCEHFDPSAGFALEVVLLAKLARMHCLVRDRALPSCALESRYIFSHYARSNEGSDWSSIKSSEAEQALSQKQSAVKAEIPG